MNIVVFIDGVLRGGFGQPMRNGVALYKTLAPEHRLLLIGSDEEADKRWLKEEGLTGYAHLAALHRLDSEHGAIFRTLALVRLRGEIDFVLTADPEQLRQAYMIGYEGLLFIPRAFAKPSWRPDARKDKGPTPWEAFTAEVREQRRAAAEIPPVADE